MLNEVLKERIESESWSVTCYDSLGNNLTIQLTNLGV